VIGNSECRPVIRCPPSATTRFTGAHNRKAHAILKTPTSQPARRLRLAVSVGESVRLALATWTGTNRPSASVRHPLDLERSAW